jgi:hypothetical protein
MSRVTAIFFLAFLGVISSEKAGAACNCGNGNVEPEGSCTATVNLVNNNKTIRATSSSPKCSLVTYQLGDRATSQTVVGGTDDADNDSTATKIINIKCQICKP